jgi:hypothetical protein
MQQRFISGLSRLTGVRFFAPLHFGLADTGTQFEGYNQRAAHGLITNHWTLAARLRYHVD